LDIIHAYSIFAAPLMFQRQSFVLHLHGTDVRVYARQRTSVGFAIRRLIHTAGVVLVSTPDLLGLVKGFGRQAYFLPNPLDFNTFLPHESPFDLHDGFDFVLFHPSRHSPVAKRNDLLIKAIKKTVDDGYDLRVYMVDSDKYVRESRD